VEGKKEREGGWTISPMKQRNQEISTKEEKEEEWRKRGVAIENKDPAPKKLRKKKLVRGKDAKESGSGEKLQGTGDGDLWLLYKGVCHLDRLEGWT